MIPLFTVMAAPILKIKKIPIITWYAHPSLTTVLKLAHHLSDRMVTSLPTAYPYKLDKLTVIGQGIDTDLFSPDGSEPENPPMILCVGRISPVKNHPTLLKATALMKNKSTNPFQVVIIGNPATPKDEKYLDSLHQMVRDMKIEDVVRFVPSVPMYKLPTWYRRCIVHVNMTPSGFGDKVAFEAMSCGRLCLASNVGFMKTFGKYSLEYIFKNHVDLVFKLSAILGLNYINRHAVETYNRDQIVKMHSLNNISKNLLGIFSSL
jgi:glycosyltransferase involved in cell wall biosynthesis